MDRRIVLALTASSLALFAVIALPRMWERAASTDCPRWKSDVMVIRWACEEYARDHDGRYPASLFELVSTERSYLESRLPLDPWRREYRYEPASDARREPRIFTLGRDGRAGGEGDDADLDSSMLFEDE